MHTDPTGHKPCWATAQYSCHLDQKIVDREYTKYNGQAQAAAARFFAARGFAVGSSSARGEEGAGAFGTSENVTNRSVLVGPGYEGPLPDTLVQFLVSHGANSNLIDGVTIHISLTGCVDCDNAAWTWFNDIYFSDSRFFDSTTVNGYLVHELIHVRQFRDGGWYFAYVQEQAAIIKDKALNAIGIKYNIYEHYWAEMEAAGCQRSFGADPSIALNASPCNLH